jgi:hypothetical protein
MTKKVIDKTEKAKEILEAVHKAVIDPTFKSEFIDFIKDIIDDEAFQELQKDLPLKDKVENKDVMWGTELKYIIRGLEDLSFHTPINDAMFGGPIYYINKELYGKLSEKNSKVDKVRVECINPDFHFDISADVYLTKDLKELIMIDFSCD